MELKKFVPAVVVGFLVMVGLNYVVHNIWLAPVYRDYETVWRVAVVMQRKMWVMLVGQLLFVVVFVWIYARGVEEKPWAGQGIRYGIVMTLLTVVPTASSEYVVYPIPYTLAVKWMIAGGIELVLIGLIVAGFQRKTEPQTKAA